MVCGLIKYQEIRSVVPIERGGKDRVCSVNSEQRRKWRQVLDHNSMQRAVEQQDVQRLYEYSQTILVATTCNSPTTNKFTLYSKQVKTILAKNNFIYLVHAPIAFPIHQHD